MKTLKMIIFMSAITLAVTVLLCACSKAPQREITLHPNSSTTANDETPSPTSDVTDIVESTTTATSVESTAIEETATPNNTDLVASPTIAPTQSISKGIWPDDIPVKVPAFSFGTYDGNNESKQEQDDSITYGMSFHKVSRANIDKYLMTLKDKGYIIAKSKTGNEYNLSGVINNNGKVEVFIMINLNLDSSICTYNLTYQDEK